jgi:hypothetical protein
LDVTQHILYAYFLAVLDYCSSVTTAAWAFTIVNIRGSNLDARTTFEADSTPYGKTTLDSN